MNTQELQKQIQELIEKGYHYIALQDRPGKLLKSNCGRFWPGPQHGRGWAKNHDDVLENLVAYVFRFPGYYTLHYSRSSKMAGVETMEIDTRPEDQQTEKPTTNLSEPMDDRSKEERRSDELYIREILSKNGFLESEVKRLQEKIAELEDEIEAISAEAEENKHAQLADATTSTIGQLAQVLPGIVDKYFQIQEQKNALLAEQMIQRRQYARPQQPVPGPQNGEYHYEG
jgi:predicted ribosome quality control (RQC) complex YloA/Tae2 family protein